MSRALAASFGLACAVLAVTAGRLQRRCERWLNAHPDPTEGAQP